MRQIKSVFLGFFLVAAVLFVGSMPFSSKLPMFGQLEYTLLFFFASIAGVRLPDIDLVMPGLQHRSAVTHSCLPVLVPVYCDQPAIAAGLGLSIALHLASDLQPRAWSGGALIRLPLFGALDSLSPLWILIHMIVCLYLLFENLPGGAFGGSWFAVAVIVPVCFWYFTFMEKRRFLPMLSLAFGALLIVQLHERRLEVDVVIQYFGG